MTMYRAICHDVFTGAGGGNLVFKTGMLPSPGENEVQVHFIASPINMQDELVYKQLYPTKPKYFMQDDTSLGKENDSVQYPIMGYDGVASVTSCGSNVTALRPGDLVIPRVPGLGTWRSDANVSESEVIKIPNDIDPYFGCVIRMVYTVAYLLVTREVDLKPGDCVLLNGATGRIAQAVVQFARIYGINTICVLRDEEQPFNATHLLGLGASKVLSETQLSPEELNGYGPVKLAIDSVFGQSGSRLSNCLSVDGTFLSLGYLGRGEASSKDYGIQVSEYLLFNRSIKFRNFRLSERLQRWSDAELRRLWIWFGCLHKEGKLVTPQMHVIHWTSDTCLESVLATVKGDRHAMNIFGRPIIDFVK